MTRQSLNVRKTDIHPADAIRAALSQKSGTLRMVQRCFRFNWWRGTAEGSETTITVEPHDDRR
jgi:hypothetical protein